MTAQPDEHQPLAGLVAENVRVLMARRLTRQITVAHWIGITQGALSKKLHGDRPFTLDEIETLAAGFGVPAYTLLVDAQHNTPVTGRYTTFRPVTNHRHLKAVI